MTATSLQQLITERIAKEGPLTFAEYMRMALYEPNHGYYVTGPAKMGWEEGDYYTSTDVSAFFANCLGRQLYQWWGKLGQPTPFLVLEQGAGRGHLAQGVQNWAKQEAPDLSAALDYRIADIRLGQDANTPLDDGKQNVRVPLVGTLSPTLHTGRFFPQANKHAPAAGGHKGPNPHPHHPRPYANQPLIHTEPSVILCNELIDAFPVHIVEVHDKQLYEVYVDVQAGRLYEVLDEPSTEEVASYLECYKIPWQSFPHGWRAEINLDALHWIRRTAHLLSRGFMLVIDYGDKARNLYTPSRRRGTLLCYFRHQMNERPFLRPGEQDITAHVNFSALIDEGRHHGLRLNKFTTQRLWLAELGIYEELEGRRRNEFAAADTERASDRGQVALLQWRNLQQRVAALTDPAGMGNFKVMVLRR